MSAGVIEQRQLQLAVSKAALLASLSAPGETKAPAQLVASFETLLTSVTSHSSQRNVKETRVWILQNCKSAKQVTAAVRFMSALAATLPTFTQRLSLLYVLNDVLFHAKTTFRGSKEFVGPATVQFIPVLLKWIHSAPNARIDVVEKVMKLWSDKNYFTDEEFAQIRGEEFIRASTEEVETVEERNVLVKPTMLGTSGDPHWLLPVSCMLEVMEFTNNYKPVSPASVKAIKLSEYTDPELMKKVESFESSIHEWKFREEEGSEGEEFDGEGWNLKFWNDREGREEKRRKERVRRQALEKIQRLSGLIKPVTANKASPDKSRISDRGRSVRRSSSRSSYSSSRSPSPPRRRRERSYSRSPPRRKRPHSRSRSRSPSPKRKWSPPRDSGRHQSEVKHVPSQTQPLPSAPFATVQTSQYPSYPLQYGQTLPPQNPPYPHNSGYYRVDVSQHGIPSAPGDARGQAPPWNQPPAGPSSQSYGRGEYGKRGNESHNKTWRRDM